MQQTAWRRPLIIAGIVIGVGLGGFFDGIVFHQILQWHHMLTSAGYPPTTVGNLEINTLADGLFHATTYVITAIGLVLLWRAVYRAGAPRSPRTMWGAALAGAGLFNLVEGIIDHYILGIHHVKSGPDQAIWDFAFLAIGALLVLIGAWMVRSAKAVQNNG